MDEMINVIKVPAVNKALDIIEYIAYSRRAKSVKQISEELKIPNMTAYRIIKYLASRYYLFEDRKNKGEYILGPQFSYLSHFTKSPDLLSISMPFMEDLAEKTGQTAKFGILKDNGVFYVEQVLPTTPVNIIAELRTVLPVNVSAMGKVLVAYLNDQKRADFIKNIKLEVKTEKSISTKDELEKELLLVRERGFADDIEEYARGIGCIGAPILNKKNEVIAAIGITGRITEYNDKKNYKQLVELVIDVAKQITLNYHLN